MAASTEPAEIVCFFLRSEVTEPTRPAALGQRMTASTHNATGDGIITTYTVTNTPLCCVDTVTVASVAQTEYVDYTVDIVANQVIFTTAPANLAAIAITYKYGTNWMYPDSPRDDLQQTSYPRVGITSLDEPEIQKQGMGETDTYDSCLLQIDILTYKDMICDSFEGAKLAANIARTIRNKLRRNLDTRISNRLFKPVILSKAPSPFEEDKNTFRHIITLRLEAFNIGE